MDKAKRINERAERITELIGKIDQDCLKLAEARSYIEQHAIPVFPLQTFQVQDDLESVQELDQQFKVNRERKQSLRFHVAELLSLVDMPEEYYYLMSQVEKYK